MRGANLTQAVNVLQVVILTDKEKRLFTPTSHLFDLYQVYQDAEYLPLQFSSPDYVFGTEKIPVLNASALKDKNGAVHLSLVNLDSKNTLSLETALPGANWKMVTGRILTSASVSDYNTLDKPDNIKPADFPGARKKGGNLVVARPLKSMVVLELR